MSIDFNNLINMILASGIVSLCAIAWKTYNQFIVFATKIDYVIEGLKKTDETHKEIFERLRKVEEKLTVIEAIKDLK